MNRWNNLAFQTDTQLHFRHYLRLEWIPPQRTFTKFLKMKSIKVG